jgi:hypothetical protein
MTRHHWHITGPILAAVLAVASMAAGIAVAVLLQRGLSSRDKPTFMEETIARGVRHFATPASMRKAPNPVPLTSEVIAEARAHWADHCATCHANDGSGHTEIGRSLYPKAPNMRDFRTQSLTDGELFSIIKNGIRLTGMPAWGDPAGHDDEDNWKLVHFIRHLPKLTPTELQEMKSMNPVHPMETKEEKEEQDFLEGRWPRSSQHH